MLKLVSLGANLGDAKSNLLEAAKLIQEKLAGAEILASHLYDTPPVGGPEGQQRFFNGVLSIDSPHSAMETWMLLREVEAQLGRHREVRWEARRIDLDLLLAADQRLWTPQFKLPHPRMCMRTFILEPACEVAPHAIDPVSGWSVQQLAAQLAKPRHAIYVLHESTETQQRWWQAMPQDWECVNHDANWCEWRSGNRSVHWLPRTDLQQLPPPWHALQKEHQAEARSLWGVPDTPHHARWEEQVNDWAAALGILPNTSDRPTFEFQGPRYLIPGFDAQWGVHELLAAFEAMQCEIRRLDLRCLD